MALVMRSIFTLGLTALCMMACSPSGAESRDEAAGNVAAPATDPAKVAAGKVIFQQCAACHSILGDGVGPDLRGVYGRKAASESHYRRYSPAMKASDIIWDEQNLRSFLKDPAAKVKGTFMLFPGLKSVKDLDDVVEFLKSYKG